MHATAQSPIPSEASKVLPRVQQSLELLSKGWVPLLAAIYGSGYLIVSIYHASLGLNEINPLRPKVAAVGLLFLLLVSMAVFLTQYMRSLVKDLDPSISPWRTYLFSICFGGFYLFCLDFVAAIPIQPILHFEGRQPFPKVFPLLVATGAIGLSAIIAKPGIQKIPRWLTHWATLLCLGLATVSLLLMSLPFYHQFGVRQFVAYLFLIQVFSASLSRPLATPESRRTHNWLTTATQLIVPLLAYAIGVYPHVRGAFGGGDPTLAQIFLTSAIGSDPAKQFTAHIIDETDAGFYLIQSNHATVQYIPRSLISSIEFEKPVSFF
jgi:hypothetical protein